MTIKEAKAAKRVKDLKQAMRLMNMAQEISNSAFLMRHDWKAGKDFNLLLRPEALVCIEQAASGLARTIDELLYQVTDKDMSELKEELRAAGEEII